MANSYGEKCCCFKFQVIPPRVKGCCLKFQVNSLKEIGCRCKFQVIPPREVGRRFKFQVIPPREIACRCKFEPFPQGRFAAASSFGSTHRLAQVLILVFCILCLKKEAAFLPTASPHTINASLLLHLFGDYGFHLL